MEKSMLKFEQEYELEINKVIRKIKKLKKKKNKKQKIILLQFPDGLKPYATTIADEIEKKAKCICLIWLGSCFGACDVPSLGVAKRDIDLIVQLGHTEIK